jgi:site-specific recombinase XerD
LERSRADLYGLKAHAAGAERLEVVRDIAVLEVLFATAARVTEIAHLRVIDVDSVGGPTRGRDSRMRSLRAGIGI